MTVLDTFEVYSDPEVFDPPNDAAMVAALTAMRGYNTVPEYRAQAFQITEDGTINDISANLLYDDASQVKWDSTAAVQDSATFTLDGTQNIQWGNDLIALYYLIRNDQYNEAQGYDYGTYIRFPLGQFVTTSPGFDDLDVSDIRAVTGYGKNYLLQSQPNDSFAFAAASQYSVAVRTVFRTAGVIPSDGFLSTYCDYPGDWYAKTLTIPLQYAPDQGMTYLDIVNDLLKQSGQRPIYVQPNGRWKIEAIPVTSQQPLRWRFAGADGGKATDDDVALKAVVMHRSSYSGDVWGAPNQWVFVQSGLTFQPIEGSGQYTVNNVGTPPAGQSYVGRIVRSTQYLAASGQDDLVSQGDDIVAAYLAQTEKINLFTTPWPVGRNYDIFYFLHPSLPFDPVRRVQAQAWTLPLWGGLMEWDTSGVGTV
jgi:hypothetical protein